MEAEDDNMIVLVVADDELKNLRMSDTPVKTELLAVTEHPGEVDNVIETTEKHSVELEAMEDCQYEYLEDELSTSTVINIKIESEDTQHLNNKDEHYLNHIPIDEEYLQEYDSYPNPDKHRFAMLKPWQCRSFAEQLRQEHEELRDEEVLINTLEQIMRSVKPPPPPRDFYVMNGIMLQCVYCGSMFETIPAAGRHYQERHGQRYLVCYACGVDFRSKASLLRHEKRCAAPDARVVLRARAASRARPPHAPRAPPAEIPKKPIRFPCTLCSAVFTSRNNLVSHENLHRGVRPYRCHACPSAYTSSAALYRHTQIHSDVQYVCDHCSRPFKLKATLIAHMDTHQPLRKHGCPECDRRYAQKSALKIHIDRVHRNLPPPCACQMCPKRYPRMSLLKAHMKKAHGMTIITREMFLKSLPHMTEMTMRPSKVVLKPKDEALANDLSSHGQVYAEEKYENTDCGYNVIEQKNAMDDIMRFVTRNSDGLGKNVIYIENGEVMQVAGDDSHLRDMLLDVDALVASC